MLSYIKNTKLSDVTTVNGRIEWKRTFIRDFFPERGFSLGAEGDEPTESMFQDTMSGLITQNL